MSVVAPEPQAAPRSVTFTLKSNAAKKTDDKIKYIQRCFRCSIYIILMLLLFCVWMVVTIPFTMRGVTKRYSPLAGLTVSLSACDAFLRPGTEPLIRYEASGAAYEVRWLNSAVDANIVSSAYLANAKGCDHTVGRRCSPWCRVIIDVPPAASASTTFTFEQVSDDTYFPVVTVEEGTAIKNLVVGYWFRRVGTLSVYLYTATIASVSFWGRNGDLRAINSTITSPYVHLDLSGSIYMHGVQAVGKDVAVAYRNPFNRICIGSDLTNDEASYETPTSHFASCDVTEFLNGNIDTSSINWLSYYYLRAHYDPDGAAVVTKREFEEGLGKLTCCGGSCPFESWCEGQTYRLGFGRGSLTSAAGDGLTLTTFASNLMATNQVHSVCQTLPAQYRP